MTHRGKNKSHPENVLTHDEAVRFIAEIDEWLLATGSVWTHLSRLAGVSVNVRRAVKRYQHGLLRETQAALAGVIARYPNGLPTAAGSKHRAQYHDREETAEVMAELKAWLDRTGTPVWRVAEAAGRERDSLLRMLNGAATRVSVHVAARYRELMAEYPNGMDAFRQRKPVVAVAVAAAVCSPPPLLDPLAERRGEAERRRREWIAQQAAEHQRKYGRPLGRAIEEMAA